MKHAIILTIVLFLASCSIEKRLLSTVNEVQEGKGAYVQNNRKKAFSQLNKDLFKQADNLVIIEDVVYLEKYYSFAIYSDSLVDYFQAKGLEAPKRIDLVREPLAKPKLENYIFKRIKKGDLEDILKQGERWTSHPSSIIITLVKINRDNKNEFIVKGYDIHKFIPKERLEEKEQIKIRGY
jgi:hypothetical protein